ncbi:MAG: hypothetical protein ACI4WU_02660 [Bacilli bacterium]
MKNKEKNESKGNNNTGIITLVICSIITLAIIVACVFFPDEIFGIFNK